MAGHAPVLSAAAVLIGLLCLGATYRLLGSVRALKGQSRRSWVLSAAICCGPVVWVMHVLGLLSFIPAEWVDFDIPLLLTSLAIDLGAIAFGFFCVISGRARMRAVGGAVAGAGVALTAWIAAAAIGSEAVVLPTGHLVVNVAVTAALCIVTCLVTDDRPRRRLAALMVFGSAMLAAHLLTVAAVAQSPGYLQTEGRGFGSSPVIATIIICGALLFLAVTLSYDYRLAAREHSEATRFRCLANASFEAIVVHRDGELLDANDRFLELFGQERDELAKLRLFDILPASAVEDCLASEAEHSVLEIKVETPGGGLPMEILCRRLDERGTTAIALRDLSERMAAEAQIVHLARHDMLTGLLNRAALQTRIAAEIDAAGGGRGVLALVLVDLDGFKQINDTCGHETGDKLLISVARRLQSVVVDEECVARLGGDEFAVLAAGLDVAAAERLAGQILCDIRRLPIEFDHLRTFITACAGIASFPQDGSDADTLLRNADLALFRAKGSGRGSQRAFAPEMDEEMRARHAMEIDLREAIAEGSLELHYQPQHEVATEALVGFEALIRWHHPKWGQVSPDRFIPLAEESGLILPIGEWVLETACREAAKWPEGVKVSVNFSAVQFHHGDPAALIAKTLARTGLPPERLEVEITETVLLDHPASVREALRAIGEMGVKLALDDFGAGYSSLRYLHEFNFDRLKIDRAFIAGITVSAESAAIVRAILSMSASLGLTVTAEGLETREQLDFLKREGCAEAQGFLFGAARPADTLFDGTSAPAGAKPAVRRSGGARPVAADRP